MFGKAQWFRARPIGWSVVPATWQGWLYASGWTGAIGLPAMLLLAREQVAEAFVWCVLSAGALGRDAWKIWRSRSVPAAVARKGAEMRGAEVMYITE